MKFVLISQGLFVVAQASKLLYSVAFGGCSSAQRQVLGHGTYDSSECVYDTLHDTGRSVPGHMMVSCNATDMTITRMNDEHCTSVRSIEYLELPSSSYNGNNAMTTCFESCTDF